MATSHYLSLWAISDDELNWPPRIYLIKYKEKYCHTTLQNFQELYIFFFFFIIIIPCLLMYPLHAYVAYVWKLEFNHNKEYRTIHLSNI